MNKYGITTCLVAMKSDDPRLTGEERYRVIGPDIPFVDNIRTQYSDIMRKLAGLNRHYSCLEKALIVRSHINGGVVCTGSLLIWNNDRTGSYGYYYNPPLEFHAFVVIDKPRIIVDFGLPGAIEKGLTTSDHIGPILENIEPVVLCGRPPDWLDYSVYEVLSKDDCRRTAEKFSLDI